MQKYLQRCQELVTPGCSSEATDPSHSDESRIWRRKLQKDPYKDLCGFPEGDPSNQSSHCQAPAGSDAGQTGICQKCHQVQSLPFQQDPTWCRTCEHPVNVVFCPNRSHSLPKHCPPMLWLPKSNNYHADMPHISQLFHVFSSKGKLGTYFLMIKVKSQRAAPLVSSGT